MNATQRLAYLMEQTSADARLRPVHIALIVALCHLWMKNSFNKWYPITRKGLMALSRIHSNATYHKVINELQFYGYPEYHPSFHPEQGSRASIAFQSKLQTEITHGGTIVDLCAKLHQCNLHEALERLSEGGGKVVADLAKVREPPRQGQHFQQAPNRLNVAAVRDLTKPELALLHDLKGN